MKQSVIDLTHLKFFGYPIFQSHRLVRYDVDNIDIYIVPSILTNTLYEKKCESKQEQNISHVKPQEKCL